MGSNAHWAGAASGGGDANRGDARRRCPVCKTGCTVDSVIPIYVNVRQQDQHQQPTSHSAAESRTAATTEVAAFASRDSENDDGREETEETEGPATAAVAATAAATSELETDISAAESFDTSMGTGLRQRRRIPTSATTSANRGYQSPQRCISSSAATTVTPVIRNGSRRDGEDIPARPMSSPMTRESTRGRENPPLPDLRGSNGPPPLRPRQRPNPPVSHGNDHRFQNHLAQSGGGGGGGAFGLIESFARGIDRLAAASQHRRGRGFEGFRNDESFLGGGFEATAPVPALHRDGGVGGVGRASENREEEERRHHRHTGILATRGPYGNYHSEYSAMPMYPEGDDSALATARDFLSRLLLMLSCFVILCLLLF